MKHRYFDKRSQSVAIGQKYREVVKVNPKNFKFAPFGLSTKQAKRKRNRFFDIKEEYDDETDPISRSTNRSTTSSKEERLVSKTPTQVPLKAFKLASLSQPNSSLLSSMHDARDDDLP